jgi:hypothetical protein
MQINDLSGQIVEDHSEQARDCRVSPLINLNAVDGIVRKVHRP